MRLSLLALFAVVAVAVPLVACRKKQMATPQRCDAVLASANSSLAQAEIGMRPAQTHRVIVPPCYSNADCVEVETARCAGYGCGGHAVHRTKADEFRGVVKAVEAEQCSAWEREGCEKISPRPMASCASYVPACQGGACVMVDKRATDLSVSECQVIYRKASSDHQVAVAAAEASGTCAQDDDCFLAGAPSCLSGCGLPVLAKNSKAQYEEALKPASSACAAWSVGGCEKTTPRAIPSCPAYIPRCVKGKCSER